MRTLQEVISGTPQFLRANAAGDLIKIPTGDGIALVFFGDPEAPARCALAISRALKSYSSIHLRMGLHTGPVIRKADINANNNVFGGGINTAQRVMDCGDTGHILVSHSLADVLEQLGSWKTSLHDLGKVTVKHGASLHLYNLYTNDAGKETMPRKITSQVNKNWLSLGLLSGAVAVTAVLVFGWLYSGRTSPPVGPSQSPPSTEVLRTKPEEPVNAPREPKRRQSQSRVLSDDALRRFVVALTAAKQGTLRVVLASSADDVFELSQQLCGAAHQANWALSCPQSRNAVMGREVIAKGLQCYSEDWRAADATAFQNAMKAAQLSCTYFSNGYDFGGIQILGTSGVTVLIGSPAQN